MHRENLGQRRVGPSAQGEVGVEFGMRGGMLTGVILVVALATLETPAVE